jgi:hypothetical protein
MRGQASTVLPANRWTASCRRQQSVPAWSPCGRSHGSRWLPCDKAARARPLVLRPAAAGGAADQASDPCQQAPNQQDARVGGRPSSTSTFGAKAVTKPGQRGKLVETVVMRRQGGQAAHRPWLCSVGSEVLCARSGHLARWRSCTWDHGGARPVACGRACASATRSRDATPENRDFGQRAPGRARGRASSGRVPIQTLP